MDKELLVQVIVETGNSKVRCGTAYPIAPGRLITAAHVIRDATPGQIQVSWYHQPDGERGWKPCRSIVWKGNNVDAIVLEADCPEGMKARFGILDDREPETDQRWESEGFPLVGQRGNDCVPIPLKGGTYARGPQSPLFELGVDDTTTLRNGWKGASGSPVFVDGRIIGIIVECPNDFANGRFKAVPMCQLMKDDAFKAAVELTADEQRKLLANEATRILATSPEALQMLAGRISVPDPRDVEKWSHSVIEKLLADQSPPQILTIMLRAMNELDQRKAKEAADVLEEVAYFLVPAALTISHVKQITVIVDSKSDRFRFPARTKMFVEIAMARINGRRTTFRDIANATDLPPGKLCLVEPPEQGMDDSHEAFIAAFVAELSGMIGAELLSKNQGETVRAINAELESQFDVERWQYYYVFEYPKTEAEQRKRNELAVKLDKMFPRIAFIGLDHANTPQEELDTVTRMKRILCRAAQIEVKPHGTN